MTLLLQLEEDLGSSAGGCSGCATAMARHHRGVNCFVHTDGSCPTLRSNTRENALVLP